MAGGLVEPAGPPRMSVFMDADELFDTQMADFSPEEEARMLTAMLYKKYVDVPAELHTAEQDDSSATIPLAWSSSLPSGYPSDPFLTSPEPMQSKSIPAADATLEGGAGSAAADSLSGRRASNQSEQDDLHMTIDMLNQRMEQQLSSFDQKAQRSIKRRTLQHKALNNEMMTSRESTTASVVAMAHEQLQAMAPSGDAAEPTDATSVATPATAGGLPVDDVETLVFSSAKVHAQQKAAGGTSGARHVETRDEGGQRVSEFPSRRKSNSGSDKAAGPAAAGSATAAGAGAGAEGSKPSPRTARKQSKAPPPPRGAVEAWGEGPREVGGGPTPGSRTLGGPRPGLKAEKKKKSRTLPVLPGGAASGPATPRGVSALAAPRRSSQGSQGSAASREADATPRTPNSTAGKSNPRSGQPLTHMECVALPKSSPLASMVSLGSPRVSRAAAAEPKRKKKKGKLWRRSKSKGITKEMIGLPNDFKHVSHTAPHDVGPLLSALHVADYSAASSTA